MLLASTVASESNDVKLKHKDIIERLRYEHDAPNLKDKIKGLLANKAPTSIIFGIQYEIRRLARVCSKVIDFRWRAGDLKVSERKIDNMSHFMDDKSYEVFLSELRKYKGVYTEGVNDRVETFFTLNKMTLEKEHLLTSGGIETVELGMINQRSEERMNLGVSVDIYIYQNDKQVAEILSGKITDPKIVRKNYTTSNISASSLLIKGEDMIVNGTKMLVRLNGVMEDFLFDNPYVYYESTKSFYQNEIANTILKVANCPENDEFKLFSQRFIFENKKKYGVDVTNTYRSALTKTFEQLSIERSRTLYFYFDKDGKCQYTLSNEHSQYLAKFLNIGESESFLNLVGSTRFNESLENGHAYVYITFKDDVMLAVPVGKTEEDTYAYGVIKNGDNGYLLQITKSEIDKNVACRGSATPKESQKKVGTRRYQKTSNKLPEIVSKLKTVYTVTPVSALDYHKKIHGVYTIDPLTYVVPSDSPGHRNQCIVTDKTDKRQEDRFILSTPVTISYKGAEYKGKLVNISSFGAKFHCPTLLGVAVDEKINVSFDDYAKKTTRVDLKKCSYMVVGSKEGGIHCSNTHEQKHEGRNFWDAFLELRLDHLEADGRKNEVHGLRRALANVASASNPNIQVFFRNKDGIPLPNVVGTSICHTKKWEQLSVDVLKDIFFKHENTKPLRKVLAKLNATDKKFMNFLIIRATFTKNGKLISKSLFENDSVDAYGRIEALTSLLSSKGFDVSVYAVCTSKREKINFRQFYDEVSYINSYSQHKFKTIKDIIGSTSGLFSISDISSLFFSNLIK